MENRPILKLSETADFKWSTCSLNGIYENHKIFNQKHLKINDHHSDVSILANHKIQKQKEYEFNDFERY